MFGNTSGLLSGYGSYLVFVLPALLFALWAQFRVKSAFAKYAKVASERGMTGADAARKVLQHGGVTSVPVERVTGELTDHYDAKANVIRLSDKVYDARTASAVGVAAHEAGHAVQYAESYAPVRLRSAIIPATNIGSRLAGPLFILGIVFAFRPLCLIGVVLFGLAVLFQLITLPVEIDASRRALRALSENGISEEGVKAAKSVLTAAALTYVAGLAVALGNFLRILTVARNSGRR